MADQNIANMNARLTLSAFEFIHGLEQSEAAALEFANGVEKQGKRAQAAIKGSMSGLNAGGAARAVQQIGFGVQDFASQFETRGLAGGISAVSNNVQMLGAAFGPAGLAASAFGGAIAGIVLPKLIEASGAFEDHTKKLKAYAEAQQSVFERAKAMSDFKADTLESSPDSIDKAQRKRQAEIELREKEISRLSELQRGQEELGKRERAEQERAWKASSDFVTGMPTGVLPTWADPAHLAFSAFGGKYGKGENELKAKETQKLVDAQVQELAKLQKQKEEAEKLRPQVVDNKLQKEREKLDEEARKKNAERVVKAEEEIKKFRLDALEKYGTEEEKLNAKRARERSQLFGKIAGASGAQDVLAQFDRESQADRFKLQIEKGKRELSELGQDAKSSPGVRRDSVEGIQAINRALTGRGENDIARQQLHVQEEQLKALEQIARTKDGIDKYAPIQPNWPTQDAKSKSAGFGESQTPKMPPSAIADGSQLGNPGEKPVSETVQKLLAEQKTRQVSTRKFVDGGRGDNFKRPVSENVQKMLDEQNSKLYRDRTQAEIRAGSRVSPLSENVQKMLAARNKPPQPRPVNDNVAKMLKESRDKNAQEEMQLTREQLRELQKITAKPMIAFRLGGGQGH